MKAHCISFNTEQIEALQHELASRFCKQNMMVFDLASYTVVRESDSSYIHQQAYSNAGLLVLYVCATY